MNKVFCIVFLLLSGVAFGQDFEKVKRQVLKRLKKSELVSRGDQDSIYVADGFLEIDSTNIKLYEKCGFDYDLNSGMLELIELNSSSTVGHERSSYKLSVFISKCIGRRYFVVQIFDYSKVDFSRWLGIPPNVFSYQNMIDSYWDYTFFTFERKGKNRLKQVGEESHICVN